MERSIHLHLKGLFDFKVVNSVCVCVYVRTEVCVPRLSKGKAVEHENAKCTHGDAPAHTKYKPLEEQPFLQMHLYLFLSATFSLVRSYQIC